MNRLRVAVFCLLLLLLGLTTSFQIPNVCAIPSKMSHPHVEGCTKWWNTSDPVPPWSPPGPQDWWQNHAHNHHCNQDFDNNAAYNANKVWDCTEFRVKFSDPFNKGHGFIDEYGLPHQLPCSDHIPDYYFDPNDEWPGFDPSINATDPARLLIRSAFAEWSAIPSDDSHLITGIEFNETDNLADAEIVIHWHDIDYLGETSSRETPKPQVTMTFDSDTTNNPEGPANLGWFYNSEFLTPNDKYHFYSTALHEVGHAVGLADQPNTDYDDVMIGRRNLGRNDPINQITGPAFDEIDGESRHGVRDLYSIPNPEPEPPPPQNPPPNAYELVVDTTTGGRPWTLDPANCFDTASAELLFNVYETLLFFDGERYDCFIPQLATQVWVAPPDPAAPVYTNFTLYFRVRSNTWLANVTSLDVANPVSSQWMQGYYCDHPWGEEWHLESWTDMNLDSQLGPSDIVILRNKLRPYLCRCLYVEELAICYRPPNFYYYMRLQPVFHTWCRSDLSPVPTWQQYYLTTEDVEHSFERWMVYDYMGGAQWMIYEPLLACYGAEPTQEFGQMIDNAVQHNDTHVWLNIANRDRATGGAVSFLQVPLFDASGRQRSTFWEDTAVLPIGYPLKVLFQVISQAWASILSKQWLTEYVHPQALAAGHPLGEWLGTWESWTSYWYPGMSWPRPNPPIDTIPVGATNPGVTCGTGPYILQRLNYALEWSAVRFPEYWGGWPSSHPSPPYPPQPEPPVPTRPKGWVERVTVRQRGTSVRIAELLAGDCDLASVPQSWSGQLHVDNNRFGPTRDGIRLNYPIPSLVMNAFHMTFDVEPTPDNRYGIVYLADELHPDGIPSNFFNNTNVRKAFAHLINFTMLIQDQLWGEAYQPCTVAPTGIPYVDGSITKYSYDESQAKQYFRTASFGATPLTSMGFTVHVCYYETSGVGQALAWQMATSVNKIAAEEGWFFTALAHGVSWGQYLQDMDASRLPTFTSSWLADYADVHNFMLPYCHTWGVYSSAQRYSNPAIDALLDQGIAMPDGSARSQLYNNVMTMFYNDVPTVPLFVTVGRGYMRDWIQGRYYNPLYPGIYAYSHWKWNYWRGDVDYDSRVTMGDIVAVVNAFASYHSLKGILELHPRWNFYCDIDDSPRYRWRDRKIDMGDIVNALSYFGKTSQGWIPP